MVAITYYACKDPISLQIFKDWHLIVLTMIVAGIALLLLLLGTAIPELRGKVSEIRDVERSEDETVRISQCTKLDNVHRLGCCFFLVTLGKSH